MLNWATLPNKLYSFFNHKIISATSIQLKLFKPAKNKSSTEQIFTKPVGLFIAPRTYATDGLLHMVSVEIVYIIFTSQLRWVWNISKKKNLQK